MEFVAFERCPCLHAPRRTFTQGYIMKIVTIHIPSALSDVLREFGHEVTVAASVSHAKSLVAGNHGMYDALVVIADPAAISVVPETVRRLGYTGAVIGLDPEGRQNNDVIAEFLERGGSYVLRGELHARLFEATIRLARRSREQTGRIRLLDGRVWIDLETHTVTADGRIVYLHARAFALLAVLASRPNTVMSRETILDALNLSVEVDERTVDSYVKQVRQVIETAAEGCDAVIETVRGFGYKVRP